MLLAFLLCLSLGLSSTPSASAFIAVSEATGNFQRGSVKVSAPSGALSPYTVTVTFDGAFDAKLGPPTVLCSAETSSNDVDYQVCLERSLLPSAPLPLCISHALSLRLSLCLSVSHSVFTPT